MGSKTNYTVHSLKKEDEFRKKKATVHEISNNIHIGKLQYMRSVITYILVSYSTWDL